MTRDEFKALVKAMKAVYTGDRFIPDENAFSVWYALLRDIDYKLCSAAVQIYMSSEEGHFPPTPADIRSKAAGMIRPADDDPWSKAWERVIRAVGLYGYPREDMAMEYISDPIGVEAARRLGWRTICMTESDDMMALRSNFRRIYESLEKRQRELQVLPQKLRDAVMAIRQNGSTKSLPVYRRPEIAEEEQTNIKDSGLLERARRIHGH